MHSSSVQNQVKKLNIVREASEAPRKSTARVSLQLGVLPSTVLRILHVV